uniref:NADH dehydrogenase subunit 4L n=1 Tax=Amphiura sp. JN-2020 TaxID=2763518 RepID=A0A7H0R1L0_9ECHI|nr:NADH dehydrogenase subunit 4L [Amphiura sp. JN-2020]
MSIFSFLLTFSSLSALLSMVYKKNFFLSLLISLELIFLNLVVFNFIIAFSGGGLPIFTFSLFLLALAAVDASIGISLIALINRNFNENSLNAVSLLKN